MGFLRNFKKHRNEYVRFKQNILNKNVSSVITKVQQFEPASKEWEHSTRNAIANAAKAVLKEGFPFKNPDGTHGMGRPEAFRYKGPVKQFIHMFYKGDEENLLKSGKTLKIKGEICTSSFDPKRIFGEDSGAGKIGYVFKAKPSHYFPFDANSVRNSDGTRSSCLGKKEMTDYAKGKWEYEKDYNWDEAWVDPSKSKLDGLICTTNVESVKDFIKKDKEGLKLLLKSPTDKNFIKTKKGKIITISKSKDLFKK